MTSSFNHRAKQGPVSFYVINLVDRTDRKSEVIDQLRRAGVAAKFFQAIKPTIAAGFPSVGARGCFLSHLAVLKLAVQEDRHAAIIEDDLDFSQDFKLRWPKVWTELDQLNWSIFYPAHRLETSAFGLQEVCSNRALVRSHFVIFHKDIIGAIINGLELISCRSPGDPSGGPMHVDGAYSTLRAQLPWLRTFVHTPALGQQRPSRSDIAERQLYDRLPLLQPAAQFIRKIKRRLG